MKLLSVTAFLVCSLIAGLALLVLALVPGTARACAVCLDSAWGARGFGWPFVALMLAPFAVVTALAVTVAWLVRRAPPGAQRAAR